jgi:ketopantoate hydroxymethyltransferase
MNLVLVLRRYMNLYEGMTTAIGQYVADVKSSDFLMKRTVLTIY